LGGSLSGLEGDEQVSINAIITTPWGTEINKTYNSPKNAKQYVLPDPFAKDSKYQVTINNLLSYKTCTPTDPYKGTLSNDISSLNISCINNTYKISGVVTGLDSSTEGLKLQNNGGAAVAATTDLTNPKQLIFSFDDLQGNSGYDVTVDDSSLPKGKKCSVSNGVDDHITKDVSDIVVTCQPITYPISVSVTGLNTTSINSDNAIVLQLNSSSNRLNIYGNAPTQRFLDPLEYGEKAKVVVFTQPIGKTCIVVLGSDEPITGKKTINVTCSDQQFTLGGKVSGLTATESVTLDSGTGSKIVVTGSGDYTFDKKINYTAYYDVTIPDDDKDHLGHLTKTCKIESENPSGNITKDISNVNVTCSIQTFALTVTSPDLKTQADGDSPFGIVVEGHETDPDYQLSL
jgi:hypothetical protein